jgi:glycosyltransferase involved in cell wall biosynthesis
MIIAVIATESCAAATRETVRAALAVYPVSRCEVLDLDGRYRPQGRERVSTRDEVDLRVDAIRLTHDDATLLTALTALWSAHLLEDHEPVLGLVPGVVLQGEPEWRDGPETTVAVVRAVDPTSGFDPEISLLANELFLLGTGALRHRPVLHRLAADWRTANRWLDLFVARVPHCIVIDDAVLVSSVNSGPETIVDVNDSGFTRAGRPVVALDLVGLIPDRPWLFDGRPGSSSGPLLSRNQALAALVEDIASRERLDIVSTEDKRTDSDVVRYIARTAADAGETLDAAFSRLEDWLLELLPPGDRMPVTRYLAGVRGSRPDLVHSFPQVPGPDSARIARWALEHGVHEPAYDPTLLRRAADLTIAALPEPEKTGRRRPRGVNLVGYLSGELGIGTSARLMDDALEAARIPTSTFAASAGLQSRPTATYRRSDGTRFDTSLLAVNADQTKAVAESLGDIVANSYRIGMWYWEVESFPASRDAAFSHVDEVWVATDFIRDAIAARATVPVRTVMPPLPQRSAVMPPKVPARLGIPVDRPWFFFAFDYLSTVERKNPLGLIEAFARAFPPGDSQGPVLVIKTLNAGRRLGDAERLRLVAARRPDVILIDEYLESDELTALMANCTAYVSLHRAEGLGLTIAEAMAWGRPVVVSAYSGNMQFTNSRNAFLVPCRMALIPADADPYPVGTPWGDPDLDSAAAVLRRIVDDPAGASAVGAQAAQDIRVLHSPAATASRVSAALNAAWSRKDGMRAQRALSPVRNLVRRLKSRVRRG